MNKAEHRALRIEEEAKGLVAWCGEFVAEVNDINGLSLRGDFFQFLGELQTELEKDGGESPHIPDIMNDEMAARVIDELMYRLKRVDKSDTNPLCLDLHLQLKELIRQWGLDQDPHSFATLPEKRGD